jgi:outer membrane receptor for ferrienterochelin and colicins
MAVLNPETETFAPVSDVSDIPGLRPTITNTIEAGYKGAIGGVFIAGIDAYAERVTNFIGQFEVVTPNVFMNAADVVNYLRNNGMSPIEAAVYGSIIGSVPVGTVTPGGAADPTAVMVAPRNFGEVELWGADFALEFSPTPSWQAVGTFSFISRNFFEKLDGEVDLALNTPENRGTFTLRYRDAGGAFHAEGRTRWMSGFRMTSGVYVGDVAAYTLFDLNAGAAVPWIPGTGVTLSVLNIFDRRHREFVGAPEMGALLVGKIHYTL